MAKQKETEKSFCKCKLCRRYKEVCRILKALSEEDANIIKELFMDKLHSVEITHIQLANLSNG